MPPAPAAALPVLSPMPAFATLPPRNLLRGPIDGLYLHVPFCTTKCHYCDFYSIAGHLDEAPAYVAAVGRQIALEAPHFGDIEPETIFIGGGTPTLLPPHLLERLLQALRAAITTTRLREFTVEANPNTFDAQRAAILKAAGVNRISFGAQSFHKAELQVLQRDHDPAHVPRAVAVARHAGINNINLDLIYAIPGQSISALEDNLRQALDCAPDHLSCYGLTYEPNTALASRMHLREFAPCPEQQELEMFRHVRATLAARGYQQYEISNYCLPGKACRHNLHYWHAHNYLAWGPAAAAHHSGYRWQNVRSLSHYVAACNAGQLPLVQHEHLRPAQRHGELAMLQLRTTAGIDLRQFAARTGTDARRHMHNVLTRYDGLNFFEVDDHSIRLTPRGQEISDSLFAETLAAFSEATTFA